MGDGSSTGTVTDISLDAFELLRKQLQERAEVARQVEAEVHQSHLPLIASATMDDWVSSGRLMYEASRFALHLNAEGIAFAANTTWKSYDGLDWVLSIERGWQFPWA